MNIVHRQCSDGMSDRSYPDTVDVRVDGRQRYRGCGAPIAYFNQTNETGQPNYQAPAAQPAYLSAVRPTQLSESASPAIQAGRATGPARLSRRRRSAGMPMVNLSGNQLAGAVDQRHADPAAAIST